MGDMSCATPYAYASIAQFGAQGRGGWMNATKNKTGAAQDASQESLFLLASGRDAKATGAPPIQPVSGAVRMPLAAVSVAVAAAAAAVAAVVVGGSGLGPVLHMASWSWVGEVPAWV